MREDATPWEKVVEFHGHACPGLMIGFRAGMEALKRMGVNRSVDEELVAIVEHDSCAVDAVQVLTGCTFGKGNLLFRDWGKHVFTVVRRNDGRGVRLALKPEAISAHEKQEQNAQGAVTHHPVIRQSEVEHLRDMPAEELFSISEVQIHLPETARIFPTLICSTCGEGVMEPRARVRDGKVVCPQCAEHYCAPLITLLDS